MERKMSKTTRMSRKNYYPTFEEASDAFAEVMALNGLDKNNSGTALYFYKEHYEEDPRLPPTPEYTYKKEWSKQGGWKKFFKKDKNKSGTYTFEEAQIAIQKLRPVPRNSTEYTKYQRQDNRLSSVPKTFYPDFEKRGSWDAYLLLAEVYKNKNPQYYEDVFQAKKAVFRLKIKNVDAYRQSYGLDPKLPPDIRNYYGKVALQRAFGSVFDFM